jgi:hypothetical protein
VALGDFDKSGGWTRDDIAVGAPNDDWGAMGAGSVTIWWKTDASTKVNWIDQGRLGGGFFWGGQDGGQESFDGFGHSLATGDFDHDGFRDLVIGAPWEDVAGAGDAGCVHVLYGAADGSGPDGMPFRSETTFLTRANAHGHPIPAWPEASDNFGYALVAGDFDGDGHDDLAVGAPGATVNGQQGAGAVFVFYNVGFHNPGEGFDSSFEYTLVQGGFYSPAGVAEAWDNFGAALAAGNFNGDLHPTTFPGTGPNGVPVVEDLAVGAPGQVFGAEPNVGNVTIYYGRSNLEFDTANNAVIEPSSLGPAGAFENFGASLAAGDFDANCNTNSAWTCPLYTDLAIGAPTGPAGGVAFAGKVHVLYSTSGGVGLDGAQLWTSASFGLENAVGAGFGSSLATGDVIGEPNAGCQGNACNPVELVIGEPNRSNGDDGVMYILAGASLAPLSTNHTFIYRSGSSPGSSSRFGAALAVGQAGHYSGQSPSIWNAADILTGMPGTNNVLLNFGDASSINTQRRSFGWPW